MNNITYIIPLIHPEHLNITTYDEILLCLKRTLNNLLLCKRKIHIIVLISKLPIWYKLYSTSVDFILLESNIFNELKKLDEGSISINSVKNTNKYVKYLNMKGKFHNKDKGLKYFIGLTYYFNLPNSKKSKYIGLIDADDFISKKIVNVLNSIPEKYNMYMVDNGYIMFAKNMNTSLNIKSIYPISNFSDICGSNRFFKSDFLQALFYKRFAKFYHGLNLYMLMKHKRVNNFLIDTIIKDINNNYKSWTILPLFLGKHRIFENRSYLHPYLKKFTIAKITDNIVIKYIHTSNHSTVSFNQNNDLKIESNLINRYKNEGLIDKKKNGTNNLNSVIDNFF